MGPMRCSGHRAQLRAGPSDLGPTACALPVPPRVTLSAPQSRSHVALPLCSCLHRTAATLALSRALSLGPSTARPPAWCERGEQLPLHTACTLAPVRVPQLPGQGHLACSPAPTDLLAPFPAQATLEEASTQGCGLRSRGSLRGQHMTQAAGAPGGRPCRAPGSRNHRSRNWIWPRTWRLLRVEGCDRVAAAL